MRNQILRIAAVGSSLVLMGGFVYVRAGGALPGIPSKASPPPTDQQTLMSDSKWAGVVPTAAPPATIMPGSKSDTIVTPPRTAPPTVLMSGSKSYSGSTLIGGGTLQPTPTQPPAPPRTLMSGSKSLILSDPAPATSTVPESLKTYTPMRTSWPTNVPWWPAGQSPQLAPLKPAPTPAPRTTILYGSKSGEIVPSTPIVLPAQSQSATPQKPKK